MKIAIVQMTSGIDPATNLATIRSAAQTAAKAGADMLFAPEMSVLLDSDRVRSDASIGADGTAQTIGALGAIARDAGIWLHAGSLPVASGRTDAPRANRSLVFDAAGTQRAQYDKMHRFDVTLASGERWRESAVYIGGDGAVAVDTPWGRLGLAVCYDLRFPALFNALGSARCDIIALPSAFTVPTGRAHWHVLLRARAIEASAFVIASAQTGRHADGRQTYGHSLVVDPWGEVLLDMGDAPGVATLEIDLGRVAEVRAQIPALDHRRAIGAARIA